MDIEDWRRRIDEIDAQLVTLLNLRAQHVIEVGKLKRRQNIEIYSPEREKEVIENVRKLNRGPLGSDAIQRLFEQIIEESRRLERTTGARKAPSGTHGSPAETQE